MSFLFLADTTGTNAFVIMYQRMGNQNTSKYYSKRHICHL